MIRTCKVLTNILCTNTWGNTQCCYSLSSTLSTFSPPHTSESVSWQRVCWGLFFKTSFTIWHDSVWVHITSCCQKTQNVLCVFRSLKASHQNDRGSVKSVDTLLTQSAAEDTTLNLPTITKRVHRKKAWCLENKKATNGFMTLFSHIVFLRLRTVAFHVCHLDKPLTFQSVFVRVTLGNLKPLGSATQTTHTWTIFMHRCSQFTSVLANLFTPNRKLNGYGALEWEIKCSYFQL